MQASDLGMGDYIKREKDSVGTNTSIVQFGFPDYS
jgi:hypothetical protein